MIRTLYEWVCARLGLLNRERTARFEQACAALVQNLRIDVAHTELLVALKAAQASVRVLGVRLSDEPAATILVQREFLKFLAAEVRSSAIDSAIDRTPREVRDAHFNAAASLLRPQLPHPLRGKSAGAFFDPGTWKVHTDAAGSVLEQNLRLAAFLSAMSCQEDGVAADGTSIAALAKAIVEARSEGPADRAQRKQRRTSTPATNASASPKRA